VRRQPAWQTPDALGYDVILQAFSGIMGMTGEKGGGPIRSPFSPIDQTTGLYALSGILAALMRRGQTGSGAYLEVSLFETAVAFLGYSLQIYWEKGTLPEECGSGHESLCPYQAFDALDKPVLIGIANDNLWKRFCLAVGKEEWVDAPAFAPIPTASGTSARLSRRFRRSFVRSRAMNGLSS
jgi:crotonobetainyl-CoA:carnitine CoA-transferase CaiB-like acyl-CoA transferase